MIRKTFYCPECGERTRHVHLGKNDVLADRYECEECADRHTGPTLLRSDVEQAVATDGGERQ
ncbi:hypothetical protein RH831_08790 [Halodesulfurarchaeum sp. HSR-GB]|uniref:hypothetical protein n=1 Tax=Halodesulfurarchaeum sp. HSR-GB TaxID=3074077 RepID=UPI0028633435|nr:hypothetical protein [Halodesulfurarchaeum sp. HSR-GB]MDR5657275.1 hypothetical protein [Halodesulfurarchaeum sp. HSR-GB]